MAHALVSWLVSLKFNIFTDIIAAISAINQIDRNYVKCNLTKLCLTILPPQSTNFLSTTKRSFKHKRILAKTLTLAMIKLRPPASACSRFCQVNFLWQFKYQQWLAMELQALVHLQQASKCVWLFIYLIRLKMFNVK